MALFFHFGPNTFTDSEWGTGHADPTIFNPTKLNASQWIHVAKEYGFSRVLLTAKHHDGFCLWPSEYTDYSVRSSNWRNGNGDVVADLAAAAKDAGVGLGVYLSPWDRHEECYGDTLRYNQHYLAQMTELLTRYEYVPDTGTGTYPVLYFVGLNSPVPKGRIVNPEFGLEGVQTRFLKLVVMSLITGQCVWKNTCWDLGELQPSAAIYSDSGPDNRWVGNEYGIAGSTCWSLFNRSVIGIGDIDNDPEYLKQGDPFGSEWVPALCDVSIRPGWFWHPSEHPKSARKLLEIYYTSVGRNCKLLLNVPPNSSGLISSEDIQVLREFSELRRSIFSHNLAASASLNASSTRGGIRDSRFSPYKVLEEGIHTYWAPEESQTKWILYINLKELVSFNVLQVQEPIQMGQRVIEFHLEALNRDGLWKRVVNGTTIGYQRLLLFPKLKSQYLKLVVDKSRAEPLISYLGIYMDPVTILNENVSDKRSATYFNGTQFLRSTTNNSSHSATM
ncbi:alpha-L-fucosidase 1-like protein [Trifolium pratense]|uniref:alpha-L-fucosidase n=1 Tax=Trifolium pratense TaxID=57577 RepID=A0A2K3P7E8_TRIPR|nr:alpha-L-fucosidase 1-like protein [Trifolium pratense]